MSNFEPDNPANAAILNPDGTAALIRIAPDTDTVTAVLHSQAYGLSPNRFGLTFWAVMPPGFSTLSGPWGYGEPNLLAEQMYLRLANRAQRFQGIVVAVDTYDPFELIDAADQYASHVRDLRSPIRRSADDDLVDLE